MSLASLQGQESDDQSIPGEWDEFDKVKPMHKGPDEDSKSSIDNIESAISDSNGNIDKRDDDQLQQDFIQITFKVNSLVQTHSSLTIIKFIIASFFGIFSSV